MKKNLFLLALLFSALTTFAGGPNPTPPSSAFGRQLLSAPNATSGRTVLGLAESNMVYVTELNNVSNRVTTLSNSTPRTFSGFTSNLVQVASVLYPSNIFLLPSLISGTLDSRTLTTTGNGFSNVYTGDDITITNDQYTVIDKPDNNTLTVFEAVLRNYSSAGSAYVYPSAMTIHDINNADGSWIGNDGSFRIAGRTTVNANGGSIFFFGRTNSWKIQGTQAGDDNNCALRICATGPAGSPAPDVVNIRPQNGNNYQALEIQANGSLSLRYGLTNNTGNPIACGPLTTPSATLTIGTVTEGMIMRSKAGFTGTGTLSGGTGSGPVTLTGSGTIFTGECPVGSLIYDTNNTGMVVVALTSDTEMTVVMLADGPYNPAAGMPFSVQKPSARFPGLMSGDVFHAVSTMPNGDLFIGADGTSPAIIFQRGGSIVWEIVGSSNQWAIHQATGNGSNPFYIKVGAPDEALGVDTNGFVNVTRGITNSLGTVTNYGSMRVTSDLVVSGTSSITANLKIQNNATGPPTVTGSNVSLWDSNKVLYAVSATKTNLLVDLR